MSGVFLGRPVQTLNTRRHHGGHCAGKFLKSVPPDALKMDYLALPVLRIPCKTFSKLLSLRYEILFFVDNF